MNAPRTALSRLGLVVVIGIIAVSAGLFDLFTKYVSRSAEDRTSATPRPGPSVESPDGPVASLPPGRAPVRYQPHAVDDTGGYYATLASLRRWGPDASLEEIARSWEEASLRAISACDGGPQAASTAADPDKEIKRLITK